MCGHCCIDLWNKSVCSFLILQFSEIGLSALHSTCPRSPGETTATCNDWFVDADKRYLSNVVFRGEAESGERGFRVLALRVSRDEYIVHGGTKPAHGGTERVLEFRPLKPYHPERPLYSLSPPTPHTTAAPRKPPQLIHPTYQHTRPRDPR